MQGPHFKNTVKGTLRRVVSEIVLFVDGSPNYVRLKKELLGDCGGTGVQGAPQGLGFVCHNK